MSDSDYRAYLTITCQADRTWDIDNLEETVLPPCICKLDHLLTSIHVFTVTHCLTLPKPPDENKLKVEDYQEDDSEPRRWNEKVNFTCDAGGDYNRFSSDFSKNMYTLTCQTNNTYETPEWPKCVPSKILFR